MSDCEVDDDLVNHPQQPTIDEDGMWIWPGPEGTMKKPVVGNFAVNLVTVYGTEIPPYQANEDVDEGIGDSGSVSTLLSFVFSVVIVMTSLLL